MILAFPQIWLPKFSLFDALFITGKHQRDPVTGKHRRNRTTGKTWRNLTGATCNPCCACDKCAGETPSQLLLRLPSVSLCTGCVVIGTSSFSLSGSLPAELTLQNQDPDFFNDVCTWGYRASGGAAPVIATRYTGSTICSGSGTASVNFNAFVQKTPSSTQLNIQVYAAYPDASGAYFFFAQPTSAADCCFTQTGIVNGSVACGANLGGGNRSAATGGTAEVEFLCAEEEI